MWDLLNFFGEWGQPERVNDMNLLGLGQLIHIAIIHPFRAHGELAP
jgi:hypothetical protein